MPRKKKTEDVKPAAEVSAPAEAEAEVAEPQAEVAEPQAEVAEPQAEKEPAKTPTPKKGKDSRPDHIKRAEDEGAELEEKMQKLITFLTTDEYRALHDVERDLLQRQKNAMVEYYNNLVKRVNLYAHLNNS